MTYLSKNDVLQNGYNPYIEAELDDKGTLMDVGLLVLEAGQVFTLQEAGKEVAVLLLAGEVHYAWNEHTCDAKRPDCFHYEAYCLLAGCGTNIQITAHSHSELYIQKTANETAFEPVLYTPQAVKVQHAGANGDLQGCMEREIKTFFDFENAPFSNMVLGEVLNHPGRWSSYPPHHHPQPEVYFYRFDRPQGFGAGFAGGEIYQTGHNGLSIITSGFHSQVAAPGYAMCYVWGIRHLPGNPWKKTRIDNVEHTWLLEPDANDKIYQA